MRDASERCVTLASCPTHKQNMASEDSKKKRKRLEEGGDKAERKAERKAARKAARKAEGEIGL